MESWQEKSWQYTLDCLESSAEREAGLIVLDISGHREETEIEKELHRNRSLNKLQTLSSTRDNLSSHFGGY